MGFFATFWSWLNGQLTSYIGANTAALASALEPAVVTLAAVYVMAWGYLQLTGQIEEPLVSGAKRIALLALVFGAGLHVWLYNSVIVDTFYRAPAQLAAALVQAKDPVTTIDAIWQSGGAVASSLWAKAHVWAALGFYVAAVLVWCLVGLLCIYAMFLIALSSIAQAVLLALGPLFIVGLLFDATRRFFSAWLAQLANYALVTVLTVMVAGLLLGVVQSYAAQTAARSATLAAVDAIDMLLVSVLVLLILRQVMPIAASLAGGFALSTPGLMSGAARAIERRWAATAGKASNRTSGNTSDNPGKADKASPGQHDLSFGQTPYRR
jgi:type IV secretion system protein VirB6